MNDPLSDAIVRFRALPLERTPQRLDPLGVQSAWPLIPLLGAVAIGYGALSTVVHRDQLRSPGLAALALALLVVAAVVAVVRTYPGFAPVGRWSHLAIAATVLAAACLFDAAVWGENLRVQDDWGQIAVALLLLMMPLYRPISEALAVSAVSAFVLGALAAVQAPSMAIDNNPLVYAMVAATPILALAAGASGYARTMTGETLAWREVARAGQGRLDGELRQAAERMIVQERTTALNADAVPFLTALLAGGRVTSDDRDRARAIADELRAAAVAAIERTWLAEMLALALASSGADAVPLLTASRAHDPDRLERALGDDQRAVVGAIVATVARLPGLDPGSVAITVSEPDHPVFVFTARLTEPRRELRRALLPFLSALRSTGLDAGMRVTGGALTLRFAYPGHSGW